MKRYLAFPIIFALLLSMCCFASAEAAPWVGAYENVLAGKQAEAVATESGYLLNCYTLYDIDKDGSPELIVKMGTCEADFHGYVYTVSNGQAVCVCDDLGFGHCAVYSDPGENGVILMYGHMGYAWAERMCLGQDGALSFETLYEDDLNARLATDPDAAYIEPGEVVPGAAYLDMSDLEKRLPISRYEEIERLRAGEFPAAGSNFPHADPDFFEKIMRENYEVVGVSANQGLDNLFCWLLQRDVAADWMDSDLQILSVQLADLNGDGWLDCIVDLCKGESGDHMHFFLTEQNGTVYAYLENYASEEISVDKNGNLLCRGAYYSTLERLLFDGEEAMFLTLPQEYFAA